MAFKYYSLLLTVFNYYILLISGQTVESDPGVHDPALELVHLYYDQFPTGKFIYPSQYQLFSVLPPFSLKDLNLIHLQASPYLQLEGCLATTLLRWTLTTPNTVLRSLPPAPARHRTRA